MQRSDRWRRLVWALGLLAIGTATVHAAPEDEPDEPVPGVRATFAGPGDQAAVRRIVPDLTADWGDGGPDPRVPADRFVARWSGLLLVQAPGEYRFFARTDGTAALRVARQLVADGAAVGLKPGFTPIALEYRHDRGEAFSALDWEGPTFGREPVPARLLFHDRQADDEADRFEAGRRAADRYGCANCHALLDLPRRPRLGPPLTDVAHAVETAWLLAWLQDPTSVRPLTRMPAFGHGLTPAEAADVAAFLDRAAPRKSAPPTNEVRMALNVASAEKGRLLFRSLGCLGCHVSAPGIPRDGAAAPDLADLSWKRTQSELTLYLVHPKGGAASHRADLRLTPEESAHLAAYLHASPARPRADAPTAAKGDPQRGRVLAERARCAACHEIPGLKPPAPARPLKAGSPTETGCLAAEPAAGVPRFALAPETRKDLAAFIAAVPTKPSPTGRATRGEDAVRRWNCLGCHTRDGQGGTDLGTQVAALLGEDPALGGKKGTLTPPNLTAVGDKLRPEYLAEAIHGAAPTARPWLSVRMPVFPFEPGEAEAIAALFRNHDRMRREPDPASAPTRPDAHVREYAARLIGQRGFGCVSCHVLAGRIPPGGEPETLGPDLALAHRRMTERYFRRWIANPQRIIAGTPMPQFLQPVSTAPGTLAEQLDALWQLVGSTQVGEAVAFGTREFLKREGDRALVVRDMVLLPDAPGTPYTPRALAIGLNNDHTLLFDTDRLTWLAWWRGGFLSRTKSGRLWEWHPEGERVWIAPARPAPVVFLDERGTLIAPVEQRARFGSFREFDFEGAGAALTYTLALPNGRAAQVVETIQPQADGWQRAVRVSGVPARLKAALVETPPVRDAPADARTFSWSAGSSRVILEIHDAQPVSQSVSGASGARAFAMVRDGDGFTSQVRLQVSPSR